jgi:hypothetical protein
MNVWNHSHTWYKYHKDYRITILCEYMISPENSQASGPVLEHLCISFWLSAYIQQSLQLDLK